MNLKQSKKRENGLYLQREETDFEIVITFVVVGLAMLGAGSILGLL